ncbi:PD-(D/E)XK nuclease family transposase [Paenibacillus sp. OK003]
MILKTRFVFKNLFGREENKDLPFAFLNQIFQETGEQPLQILYL